MPKLVARSLDGHEVAVDLAEPITIGRVDGCELRLDFDTAVSRRHGTARWEPPLAVLDCYPQARNGFLLPHASRPQRQVRLRLGESAIIGRTRLTCEPSDVELDPLTAESADASADISFAADLRDEPDEQYTIAPLPAAKIAEDVRLSVLSRLPSVLDSALDEAERLHRVVSLVLVGVKEARSAAIVRRERGVVHLLAWDRQDATAGEPSISSRLVAKALAEQATVMYAWYGDHFGQAAGEFTRTDETDWVFCTPIGAADAIVVAGEGRAGDEAARQIDAKFVEVMAELLRTERENRDLAGRLGQMRQFFSAPVMRAIETAVGQGGVFESELLAPRECELAVLFCDLRGFSAGVEASDNLLAELERVREALGVMTQAVLDHGGVTGEFLGDAVLGFWGWPLESDHKAIDCCRAALQIARTFGRDAEGQAPHGIGLAFGRAVAGRIQTGDRTSINAFGPALNLASRLQTLTKHLRVPILVSDQLRTHAAKLSPDEGRFRLLGRVVPYGLSKPLEVSELALPHGLHPLADEDLVAYEAGARAFIAGDWETAYERFRQMPADDRASDFLLPEMARHGRTPPNDWDGALRMDAK